jgi:hypothetical protein
MGWTVLCKYQMLQTLINIYVVLSICPHKLFTECIQIKCGNLRDKNCSKSHCYVFYLCVCVRRFATWHMQSQLIISFTISLQSSITFYINFKMTLLCVPCVICYKKNSNSSYSTRLNITAVYEFAHSCYEKEIIIIIHCV